jgi:hypothetical protein
MATSDEATVNEALLALYGALDHAVTHRHNSGVEDIVERYLPGSTGGNAGWYDELLGFLSNQSGSAVPDTHRSPTPPGLSEALTKLENSRIPTPDEELGSDSLSTVQLSRMVYAIGALSQLPTYQGIDSWDDQFSRTLTIVMPAASQQSQVTGSADSASLLALLRSDFRRRDDFPGAMKYAFDQHLIDPRVAKVPLCDLKAKWVAGHLSAVLTTEFESDDVSLDELTGVVDPLNWAKCLSFFCAMEHKDDRSDGWSRVLEHVSTTCAAAGTPQMVTPLKYWKGPPLNESALTAYLNYALDDAPAPDEKGDGRVVVDEGFIRMSAKGNDPAMAGVRVRTRKVVAFRNLPWIAGAIFACSMGYGYEGMSMLLDGVEYKKHHGTGWKGWEPSTLPQSGPPGQPGEPNQPGKTGKTSDPSRRAVTIAIAMANECIDDMSSKSAAIAAKWAAGQVPIEETIAYSTDLAVRLAVDPWRFLERLRDPAGGNDS